ncbi:MAG: chlorophyll synthase ChlG [Proteobacteria bacterium]|nr:chlorophyll synthase ChlG [Pseudomonadota bacterium]
MAHPAPRAVIELLKPITWFAPMWAFACGLISVAPHSGASASWLVILLGVLLAGPLVCATSQAANDWFDREVDAINEPQRPIPSGRVPGRWGLYIAIFWTALSLVVARSLGAWVFWAGVFGLALAWFYSAPPLRLKQNGWWGNAAVALCYEGVPWITGAAIMAVGAVPDARILLLAALYSIGAHGIMTLNDFKSVEGDTRFGVRSLPVRLGVARAAKVACLIMAGAQAVVVVLLLEWARPWHAAAVALLLVAQGALMVRLLQAPRERAPWYNATGTSLYVLGMLVSAFALRSVPGGS